jgi:hypothetical protein
LEVIFALGIFAGGIVILLGSCPALMKSGEGNTQAMAAARIGETFLAQLRSRPFSEVAGNLKSADERARDDTSATADRRLFWASLDGGRIAASDDALWTGHEGERFFELVLFRDAELSPVERDATAGWLVFSVRIRWPVTAAGVAGGPSQDRLWLAGAVHR